MMLCRSVAGKRAEYPRIRGSDWQARVQGTTGTGASGGSGNGWRLVNSDTTICHSLIVTSNQ